MRPRDRRDPPPWLGRRLLTLSIDVGRPRRDRRAWSGARPADLERLFAPRFPPRGLPPSAVLARLRRTVVLHSARLAHPRLFGLFMPAPLSIAALAALPAAFLNQSPDAWKAGPSATHVEMRLVRMMARRLGLGRGGFGTFTGGGGAANLLAMKMARDRALGAGARRAGLRGRAGRLRVYASDQAHFSLARALDVLGLGERALVPIRTGPDRRLPPDALRRALRRDRLRGLRPMAVVATAGTTTTGSVDPLGETGRIARGEGAHFHVDAAYGGALLFSRRHRVRLAGIETADTVTLDPHKWLFQPFGRGLLFARTARALHRACALEPEYLRKDLEAGRDRLDFYQYSLEGSRPFRGLSLWMTLLSIGPDGLGDLVDRTLDVARHLARRVAADARFEGCGAAADLASVCFRYRPVWTRAARRGAGARSRSARRGLDRVQIAIQREVERRGYAWFPTVRLDGEVWFRFGVFNVHTTERDVDDTLRHVARVAADLGFERGAARRAGDG